MHLCPSCLSLPPEPKTYSAVLEDSTERPLCPVAGQTSVRSGLLILESAGEGEGRQDGRSWHVSRVCPLQFVLCWSPHLCSHSRAKGILQQQPQHPCGHSFYPWPAHLESHMYWGAPPPRPLQIRTSQRVWQAPSIPLPLNGCFPLLLWSFLSPVMLLLSQ